jgi:hypothetical protein
MKSCLCSQIITGIHSNLPMLNKASLLLLTGDVQKYHTTVTTTSTLISSLPLQLYNELPKVMG